MVFVILGFLARHIRSVGALLGLELQENVNLIFWNILEKGSIWFPFSKIWLLGARIRCHGSVFRELGGHFLVIYSTLQQEGHTFQVWVKTDSAWFKTDSDLIHNWSKSETRPYTVEELVGKYTEIFISDSSLKLGHSLQGKLWVYTQLYERFKSNSSLSLAHALRRRKLVYTQQYESYKSDSSLNLGHALQRRLLIILESINNSKLIWVWI